MARLASGGRHGLAQSLFQVGGNAGSALGPLLAAFIVVPRGQRSVAWFSLVGARSASPCSSASGAGTRARIVLAPGGSRGAGSRSRPCRRARVAARDRASCCCLIFSKYFYLASLTSYYTFYLIDKFGVSVQDAQLYLFVFLGVGGGRHVRSAGRSATGSAASP